MSRKTTFLRAVYWNVAGVYRRTLASPTRVVAVVGSFGKTTTAAALIHVLGDRFIAGQDFNAGRQMARKLMSIRPGDRHRVVEVGIDGPGQMAANAKLVRPDIVVVTCIGSEHHRSLGSLEETRAEKAVMVAALRSGGVAVLNGDDPNVRWMATQTRARKIFYGLGEDNEVRAVDIHREANGELSFTVVAGEVRAEIRGKLVGRHQIYSYLAAAALALHEKIPLAQIVERLESLVPQQQRMNIQRTSDGVTMLCDEYKSTLETVHAALDVLADFPGQRKIAVMGDVSEPPGSQGPVYRELGARLAGIANLGVHVGHMFQRYSAGLARAGFPRGSFIDAGTSVIRAAEILREHLQPGDIVLIKGRDNQKLQRVTLQLLGQKITCDIPLCDIKKVDCSTCPKLCASTLQSERSRAAQEPGAEDA